MIRFLALVCILLEDNFGKHGLIDYNFHCFRQAIQEVRLLFDKGILIVIHGRVENALSLKGRELNPLRNFRSVGNMANHCLFSKIIL